VVGEELRGFAPIGVLACPGATCLERAVVAVIFWKRSLCNSGRASQVWAREQWSAGMMGELVLNKMKETNRKTILSAFTAHCSGTPTLHHSM